MTASDDVTALRMLLTETTAERDQLRAVVADESECRRSFMGAATSFAEAIELLTAEREAHFDAYEGHLEAWEEMDRLIGQVARVIVRASGYLSPAEEAEAELDRLQGLVDAFHEIVGVTAKVRDPIAAQLDVSADIGGEP